MTIRPERKGFLWKAFSSYTTKDINDKKDVIRTIAWQSITGKNEKITLMVVEVKDEKVACIEAGSKLYEYRYPISPNHIDQKELRWYKVE